LEIVLEVRSTRAIRTNFRVVAQRGHTADYLSRAQITSRRFTINMLELRSFENEGKAMEKQARNHVNRKRTESDGASAKPTGAVSGEFVTEMFEYDGALRGRRAHRDIATQQSSRSDAV
jgi:hypothetical protein